jgi:protein arginine kinase activator
MSAMVCQSCGENPATFHLTEISDEAAPGMQTTELHYCEACAAMAGLSQETAVPSMIANAVASVTSATDDAPTAEEEGLHCPHCGMTFHEFKRKGRLGCPRDYEVFATPLESMLQKMHACGSPRHRGRVPRGPFEIRNVVGDRLLQLRRELHEAVTAERYEEAARARDEIQRIENEGIDITLEGSGRDSDPLEL